MNRILTAFIISLALASFSSAQYSSPGGGVNEATTNALIATMGNLKFNSATNADVAVAISSAETNRLIATMGGLKFNSATNADYATTVGSGVTNAFDNMAPKTNWINAVVDGNLNLGGYTASNGVFVGDGSGLTGITAAPSSTSLVALAVSNDETNRLIATMGDLKFNAATNADVAVAISNDETNRLIATMGDLKFNAATNADVAVAISNDETNRLIATMGDLKFNAATNADVAVAISNDETNRLIATMGDLKFNAATNADVAVAISNDETNRLIATMGDLKFNAVTNADVAVAVSNDETNRLIATMGDLKFNSATNADVAVSVGSGVTNAFDDMATKTNWANAVVDGNLNINGKNVTNAVNVQATTGIVTRIALGGTNTSSLAYLTLPSSTSTNEGIRFGDDVILYRGSANTLNVRPQFGSPIVYGTSYVQSPTYYGYGTSDWAANLNGAGTYRFTFANGSANWMSISNTTAGTIVLSSGPGSASTNALTVTAGTNLLQIGTGGPVVVTNVTTLTADNIYIDGTNINPMVVYGNGTQNMIMAVCQQNTNCIVWTNIFRGYMAAVHVDTNYYFYVSATNWAGYWADYVGAYHGINSNGTIRTLTNAWGW